MRVFNDASTRGDWFIDYLFLGKRLRFRAGSSKRAADALRLRIETEINEGRHDPEAVRRELRGEKPAGLTTLANLLDLFLATYISRAGTDYYKHLTKPLRAHLGDRPAQSIDGPTLNAYVTTRRALQTAGGERKVCDNSIRKELTVLSTVFKWARGNAGYQGANPLLDFVRPKKPAKHSPGIITADQEKALRAVCSPELWDRVEWAIYSGMRLGEILDLRRTDINRKWKTIKTGTKTAGGARHVPLNICPRLAEILDRLPRPTDGDLVFCKPDGSRLMPRTLNSELRAAFVAAGIPTVKGEAWNTCRHTFGSRLADQGVKLNKIAEWMGNSVSVVERHYLSSTPTAREDADGILVPATTNDSRVTAESDRSESGQSVQSL